MEILDCGHEPDTGRPATILENGVTRIVDGWTFVLTDDGRKICHACADAITLDCGHTPSTHEPFTTGYGVDTDGKRHCYECCAVMDREQMIRDGKATLYLSHVGQNTILGIQEHHEITNWPGSLRFTTGPVRRGHHNITGSRYDTWFRGPDGHTWHAVQYGDNAQIAHCKRA